MNTIVIELLVNNHPGVMSHITGLIMRRACNIEGILCGIVGDGNTSRIYLLMKDDWRIPRIVRQLKNLYDVIEVVPRDDCDTAVFDRIPELIGTGAISPV